MYVCTFVLFVSLFIFLLMYTHAYIGSIWFPWALICPCMRVYFQVCVLETITPTVALSIDP